MTFTTLVHGQEGARLVGAVVIRYLALPAIVLAVASPVAAMSCPEPAYVREDKTN